MAATSSSPALAEEARARCGEHATIITDAMLP